MGFRRAASHIIPRSRELIEPVFDAYGRRMAG